MSLRGKEAKGALKGQIGTEAVGEDDVVDRTLPDLASRRAEPCL